MLSDQDREALAEPVYDAYRLGKFGKAEYPDMWHELDVKPTGTPECVAIIAAVERIVAREKAAALREAAEDPNARLSGHSGVSVKWLRERADQIEGGGRE